MVSYNNYFYGTLYFQNVVTYIIIFCQFYSMYKCNLQVIDSQSRNRNQKVFYYPTKFELLTQ